MKTSNFLNTLGLIILAGFLTLSSPAFADDIDPLMNQARDQLHGALNPGGDPPPNDQRTALLKSALDELQKAAGTYRGLRVRAIANVKAALFELGKGDPDQKAADYIRDALDEVRDVTG